VYPYGTVAETLAANAVYPDVFFNRLWDCSGFTHFGPLILNYKPKTI
jgi:hypothetical protein